MAPGDLICATATLITVPTTLTSSHRSLIDRSGMLIVVPGDLIRATGTLITVPTSVICSLRQLIAAPRTFSTLRTLGTPGTTKC